MGTQERLAAAWRAGDLIVVVDVADLKARNWLLGFAEGDRDLADLEAMVHEIAGPDRAVRLSGNVFAACLSSADDAIGICRRFARDIPIEVRYQARGARSGGDTRQEVLWTWHGVVRRGLRVVTASPRSRGDVPALMRACVDCVFRCNVDRPIDIGQVPEARAPWSCVAGLPTAQEYACLFCRGTDLEIEGGASDVAELRCNECGATLELRHETSVG